RARGGGGGKAVDQGELDVGGRVPDTEPDRHVDLSSSCAACGFVTLPPSPEVGAVCGNPARTDLRVITPPLSQSLDPIDPRRAGRWDQESSTGDLLVRRCGFPMLAPSRGCPELPQPLSFLPIGPNDPQAARRDLARAYPATKCPVPELVRRHLK